MNRTGLSGIILVSVLMPSSCTTQSPCSIQGNCTAQPNLWDETWLKYLSASQTDRENNLDGPFVSDDPTDPQHRLAKTPINQVLTLSSVRVPHFTDVRINGCFQTQITGGLNQNTLYIAGTQGAVRQIPVEIEGQSIYIGQTKGASCPSQLRQVIVRIGMNRLNRLAVYGGGTVRGRHITSSGMTLKISGNGETVLMGHFPVKNIQMTGNGNLTLIGADTTQLSIDASGNGNLNMRGRIGVDCIKHAGSGAIHLINTWSKHLTIASTGKGLTALEGTHINIASISATDASHVFVKGVDSNYIHVQGKSTTEIGLSGQADTLEASFKDCAQFWGAHLRTRITYIDTTGSAHANVLTLGRLFAKASDNSSIYYSAPTGTTSTFTYGSAIILPMGNPSATWKLPTTTWTRAYK